MTQIEKYSDCAPRRGIQGAETSSARSPSTGKANRHWESLFSEAGSNWELSKIYQAIEIVGLQPLSIIEKTIIRALLCGYSPKQITSVCRQISEESIINFIYQLYNYIGIIGNFPQQSIQSYQNIPLKLAALGYKKTNNTILLHSIDPQNQEVVNGGRNTSSILDRETTSEGIEPNNFHTTPPATESKTITIAEPTVAIVPTQDDSLPVVEADDFMPTIDRWTRLGSLFLLGSVGIAIALAAFTPYNVTVQTEAKVRPTGELRVVEAKTEGTIVDIAVQENQPVKKGDLIATIDNSRLQTQKSQLESNIQQATLQLKQINAQINAQEHRILAETDRSNRLIASAKAELNRRRREYQERQITTTTEVEEAEANLRAAQASLNAARTKLKRYQAAADEGAISQDQLAEVQVTADEQEQAVEANQARLKRAQAALNPIDAEVAIALENIAQEQATGEATIVALKQEKEALIQQQIELEQQRGRDRQELAQIEQDLNQSAIKATIDGILFQLNLRNSGQTVTVGQEIAHIAPASNSLVIKALVSPQEIHKVAIDQPVQMKVSACPYPDYGTLQGVVSNIAPDSIAPPNSRTDNSSSSPNSGASFYPIIINPEHLALRKGKNQCKIQSGMEGKADIIAQKETVMQFLLRKARLISDL